MKPILNVLIRTSYRPEQFAVCIKSITEAAKRSTDLTVKVIVGYDDERALAYIPKNIELVDLRDMRNNDREFFYNLYLNRLLSKVLTGHAIFVDDDDTVLPESFIALVPHLIPERSLVVPFMRNNFQKPTPSMMQLKSILRGYIGLPSLIIWHDHIRYIYFDASEYADYNCIRKLADITQLAWVRVPVVKSLNRNRGIMEKPI